MLYEIFNFLKALKFLIQVTYCLETGSGPWGIVVETVCFTTWTM